MLRHLIPPYDFGIYTCRPAGALMWLSLALLYTFRPSGALKLVRAGLAIGFIVPSFDFRELGFALLNPTYRPFMIVVHMALRWSARSEASPFY